MPFWHRIVVPNEKLASDTIRNATIRSRETFAEVTLQVPLTADLGAAVALGVWA
jgi:small-conductance mechanosensitive channel